jgi:hypothetical protein
MLRINISNDGIARASQTGAAIKAGVSVPVQMVFASATVATNIAVALGPQSSTRTVLAYADGFTSENGTTYIGVLDCNDTRLVETLSGKEELSVNCEVRWTAGGVAQASPDFGLSVQAPYVTGPVASEGGPTYYTQTEVDEMLAAKAAKDTETGAVMISARARLYDDGTSVKLQVTDDGGETWTDAGSFQP